MKNALVCLALCFVAVNAGILFRDDAPTTEAPLHDCGRQFIRSGRIVGGDAAYDGEFPWMVSVLLNGAHFCGATLIAPQWVITAAHCVQKKPISVYKVRLGEYNLSAPEEHHVPVDKSLDDIILNPNYSIPIRYYNDLALLKLNSPVNFSSYIWPICLPSLGQEQDTFVGDEGTIAGWGWLAEQKEGGKRSNIIRKVTLPIVPSKTCEQWYSKDGKFIRLQNGQMCAGLIDGGKDSCQGDSGGPLMLRDVHEHYTLIGIVSAGIGCARPNLPGLYTKVSAHMSWIESYIQSTNQLK